LSSSSALEIPDQDGPTLTPQELPAWESLKGWLNKDEEGRSVLSLLSAGADGAPSELNKWIQVRHAEAPSLIATYLEGGRVEKLVNIAQAGIVLLQQTLPPLPPLGFHQLPRDLPDFTGRQQELADVLALAAETVNQSGRPPFASIVGMPGVGKSALAIHAAHLLRDRFPEIQLYVDLRGADNQPRTPEEVLREFLQALGVRDEFMPEDLQNRAALFRSLLNDKPVLVLLDNAHEEAQVRPLVPGHSSCMVIVTSRRRLSALEGVTVVELEVLSSDGALSLLEQLVAPARRPEVQDAGDSACLIAEMCGYLPLAIRIAAGKLNDKPHWTLQEFARQLKDEKGRLARLEVGDLEVRSVFAMSEADLDKDDKELLGLLGVLDGSEFVMAVAAEIWQRPLAVTRDVIERLIDAQLLEPDTGEVEWDGARIYRIHDLVRLFVREQMEQRISSRRQEDARRRAQRGWSLYGLRKLQDVLQPFFPNQQLQNVRVVNSGPICWYVRNVLRQSAFTVSPYVFMGGFEFDSTKPTSLALLAHEATHIEQQRSMGNTKYLFIYFRDLVRAGFRYSTSLPLERAAYELQQEVLTRESRKV